MTYAQSEGARRGPRRLEKQDTGWGCMVSGKSLDGVAMLRVSGGVKLLRFCVLEGRVEFSERNEKRRMSPWKLAGFIVVNESGRSNMTEAACIRPALMQYRHDRLTAIVKLKTT